MKSLSTPIKGFVSAVAGALLVVGVFQLTLWAKDSAPNITVSASPINRDAKLGTSFAPIVKRAAPSVVNISSIRIIQEHVRMNPFFRQFFGDNLPGQDDELSRSRKAESLGSGVIISSDGYILTANHVVQGASEVQVTVAGSKKTYTAKIIGTDPPTDVAVLKIAATDLPAITLANSDLLEVGDVVLAIGNPFGIGQTVTMGIVSALSRSGLAGFNQYQDFIQTDAAINPGNSGGALVDAEGRLVGINTAIISRSGGNQGVGFAVPVDMARRVVERLITGGTVERGYLGVNPQDITPGLAEGLGLSSQNGALIGDVEPGGPADQAGIKSGDVIVDFNGKPVSDAHGLRLTVSQSEPGSSATVKLIRNGATMSVKVALGELHLPGQKRAALGSENQNDTHVDSSQTDGLDGVTVGDLDNDVRMELRIPQAITGAIVSGVDPGSNSADAGLLRGDVIMEINRHPVPDADTAVNLSKDAKGKQVLLKVWRRMGATGGTLFLSVDNTRREMN